MKKIITLLSLITTINVFATSLHPDTFNNELAFNVVKAERHSNRMPPFIDKEDRIQLQVVGKVGNCGEVYKASTKVLNNRTVAITISLDYVLEIYCAHNIQTEKVLEFEFSVPLNANIKLTNPIYTKNYITY